MRFRLFDHGAMRATPKTPEIPEVPLPSQWVVPFKFAGPWEEPTRPHGRVSDCTRSFRRNDPLAPSWQGGAVWQGGPKLPKPAVFNGAG